MRRYAVSGWLTNTHSLTNLATGLPDDWFELYNSGVPPVALGGFQLSNLIDSLNKFIIPQGTVIPGQDFLLVWADKVTTANALGTPLRVSFKLRQSGEEIGLFAPGGALVYTMTYGPQESDISEDRDPDGNERSFARFFLPTPGSANVPHSQGAQYDRATGHLQLLWTTQPGLHYRIVFREDDRWPVADDDLDPGDEDLRDARR